MENNPNNNTKQTAAPNPEHAKWQKLGEEVRKISDNYRPLEGLSNKNLEAIANAEKTNPTDREFAMQEMQKRHENNEYKNHDSDVGLKEDFDNNYIGMAEGRIYVPTENYKKYRKRLENGRNVNFPANDIRRRELPHNLFDDAREIVDDILEGPELVYFYARLAYEDTYVRGLAKDDTSEPSTAEVLTNFNLDHYRWKYRKMTDTKIIDTAVKFVTHDLLRSDIEEYISNHKTSSIKNSVFDAVIRGNFLPKTIKENPEKADQFLSESHIEKNNYLKMAALIGYNKQVNKDTTEDTEAQVSITNYFDLNEFVIKMMKDPDSSYIDFAGNICIEGSTRPGESTERTRIKKNSNIGKRAYGELRKFVDEIAQNPEYEKQSADVAQKWKEQITGYAKERFDADKLFSSIDTRSISPFKFFDSNISRLREQFANLPFTHLISDEQVKEKYDAPVEVNSAKIVKDLLLEAINTGEDWQEPYMRETTRPYWDKYENWWGHYEAEVPDIRLHPATDIFESEKYKEYETKIGIDFTDPEVFDLAMDGFINVLRKKAGPESHQANWYFENIFANDPEKFEAQLAELYKLSDRGDKARITRFKKNSPAYFEYHKQAELDRLTGLIKKPEELGLPGGLEVSSYKELKDFLDNYLRRKIMKKFGKNSIEVKSFRSIDSWIIDSTRPGPKHRKASPDFFGWWKLETLNELGRSLEDSGEVDNVVFLKGVFPGENKDGTSFAERYSKANLNSDMTYCGFAFTYEGHRCAIFESLNDTAATYFFRGEANDDPREFFNNSKRDNFYNNSKVARVSHLDREHINDSINTVHKKGFLFFRTGDKQAVNYGSLDDKAMWNEYFDAEFPAYPMNIHEEPIENMPDLERYREWQNSAVQNPEDINLQLAEHYLNK